MAQIKTLGRNVLWVILRGAVLGLSLSAFFPAEETLAGCVCDDDGKGKYECPSGTASYCMAGTQECRIRCGEPELE